MLKEEEESVLVHLKTFSFHLLLPKPKQPPPTKKYRYLLFKMIYFFLYWVQKQTMRWKIIWFLSPSWGEAAGGNHHSEKDVRNYKRYSQVSSTASQDLKRSVNLCILEKERDHEPRWQKKAKGTAGVLQSQAPYFLSLLTIVLGEIPFC